ncbi:MULTISPECIES: DUF4342 domain-containing protein [unclassified Clostridium]|uniref:DUF4342 domain-containing protein n=1 Tax=unclassified Clostridium TaxID=2614128 RepID=UPI0032180F58
MDEATLKKINILKERANLSEEEAEDLLERFNGDLIEALIHCEREKQKDNRNFNEKISQSEFVTYIKELIKAGNVSRIIIRKDDSILVNIPVNAGIVVGIALLLQPVLIVLGAATAVFIDLEIDIIKEDGTVEVVNKIVKSTMETTAKKATEVTHDLKEIFSETSGKIKEKISEAKNSMKK